MVDTAIIDTTNLQVIKVGNYCLNGKCKRCGACCDGDYPPRKTPGTCKYLKNDGMLNSVKIKKCSIEPYKPCSCKLWPIDPDQKLPVSCGFYWEAK